MTGWHYPSVASVPKLLPVSVSQVFVEMLG